MHQVPTDKDIPSKTQRKNVPEKDPKQDLEIYLGGLDHTTLTELGV